MIGERLGRDVANFETPSGTQRIACRGGVAGQRIDESRYERGGLSKHSDGGVDKNHTVTMRRAECGVT